MIEPSAGAALPAAWEVGALLQAVGQTVATRFSACTVQGELSGFSRASSGHCYFTLKDSYGAPASIRCAMFRRAALLMDFAPADGKQVLVRGRLGVYEPRGELQLVAESMRAAGAGALYERFVRLRERLDAEGLFDAARKRELPRHPRSVGVVTSLGAAALRDVLTTLTRRARHVQVVVYPSPVQGADAAPALAAAIELAGARCEVEVLIVCRGGGSIEDLWSFNDETVVRAIAASPLPVVCGVGHETDVTLADLAADLRAATPTAAAELVAPATDESLTALAACEHALRRRLRRRLDSEAQQLDGLSTRLARPGEIVQRRALALAHVAQRLARCTPAWRAGRAAHLQQLSARLERAAAVALQAHGTRLAGTASRLDALAPARVLARGYAWLAGAHDVPLTSVHDVRPGDLLRAVLHDGSVAVRVEQVEASAPAGPA